MSLTFDLIIEHKIKTLEEETMLGLYDIINRMHKHAVRDYINVISCYFDEDSDKPQTEVQFDETFRKNVFEMFEHIEDDLKYRLKNLKLKLIKRFDIQLESIESESESESESEIENEKIKIPNSNEIKSKPTADEIKSKPTDDSNSDIDVKSITNDEDFNEIKIEI